MRRLILVKHSLPEIDSAQPPERWLLGAEGRARCGPLAARLADLRPDAIVTSDEPKAVETGRLVATQLGRPCRTAPGLHEHRRTNVPFLGNEAWVAAVAEFFARPTEWVMGLETATQVTQRFAAAVETVLATEHGHSIAIVTHGTVISLYVASRTGIAPFPLWQRLDLPSFVVMTEPEGAVIEVVDRIEVPSERSPL